MAKKSAVLRDEKRRKMYEKYKDKREALQAAGDLEGLQKLPRNSSPTRLKNRDMLDGRPRGYMRRFGLSRINFREKASKGEIPGVTKSSWQEKGENMSLQSTDQIADLITRIRNAVLVGKNEILVPTSKLKAGLVEVLAKNGYVAKSEIIDGKPRGMLKVTINEPGTVAKINEISKVSKPGRRVYSSAEDLPTIKSGRGMIIVSTSKGLMTGREAKKNRLGGEILVKVW